MLKIDSDKTIRITRGDSGTITITATDNNGDEHIFVEGDIVRLKVMEKNNVSNIIFSKDATVSTEGTSVDMALESSDTRLGEYINKPFTYWYEVELNPEGNSNTIIGYDEDGAKEFILYPEGE